MTGFQGYDQWKTASPYDDYDDEHCDVCGMKLDPDPPDDSPAFEGFCSTACQDGKEHWHELCALTEPGQSTPTMWTPPCVRPMYELLCDELQRGSGDGVENNVALWSKSVYKGSSCGASLSVNDAETISINSIIEGVDEYAETQTLSWPFTSEQFWDAVQAVEDDVSRIWNETHGCDACAKHFVIDPEFHYKLEGCDGMTPVWDKCPDCGGNGIVI